MSDSVTIVWDDGFLGYDLGDHPMDPVRLELTMALARELGILDRPNVTVLSPEPASEPVLEKLHTPAYIAAMKSAPEEAFPQGHGLNTPDNPVFDHMHEASALIAGGTILATRRVWNGDSQHAVNIAGGLHHAMRDHAWGFCYYNDPALAIREILDEGAERVAYIDIDVHHGDGVQAAFWDDPRVLTISLHESGISLFPGSGFADETGGAGAEGRAVNIALPPGTTDSGWQRAFHAIVPSLLRAFRPQLLFTQCGADPHARDPLANLRLSVDGQRTTYHTLHELAHELCDGKWVATGGGGYGLVEVVPRAWTHLLAEATGQPIPPETATPEAWRELAMRRQPRVRPPSSMTDGVDVRWEPWVPGAEGDAVDRAIQATRDAVFPSWGLDPHDPRD